MSSKPTRGKEPAALQSTRQMLDELDALMERMLALPVNELEEPASADSASPDTYPRDPEPGNIVRMPTVSATLTVVDTPGEETTAPAVEERPSYFAEEAEEPPPNYVTQSPPPHAIQAPRKVPPPEPIPEEAIPPSITSLPVLAVQPIRPPRRSLGSLWIKPLQWTNRLFDLGTYVLGNPGGWLRTPRGRTFLGMAGLALLGAAAFWLIKDWLGWVW